MINDAMRVRERKSKRRIERGEGGRESKSLFRCVHSQGTEVD